MKRALLLMGVAAFALSACDETTTSADGGPFINPLPDRIVDIAGPNQNLNAVKVDPVDGCLVYRHVGPVETTFLPLRTREGRPICTRAAPEAAPAA